LGRGPADQWILLGESPRRGAPIPQSWPVTSRNPAGNFLRCQAVAKRGAISFPPLRGSLIRAITADFPKTSFECALLMNALSAPEMHDVKNATHERVSALQFTRCKAPFAT
jgi:hypothetical protein